MSAKEERLSHLLCTTLSVARYIQIIYKLMIVMML